MMKQTKANQLRAILQQKQQAISFDELKIKGPKYTMDQIQYCVSDDEYDNYEENLNFRYAKLMQMDEQVKPSKKFLSVKNEAKRFSNQNPKDYFNRQQGSKPRSNSPRRKSTKQNKKDDKKGQNGITQQNSQDQNQRKSTIKKSQTQEEQTLSKQQETTPKNDSEKQAQNAKNLRNTIQVYIENQGSEQNNPTQSNIVNYKIRSSSYEETSCLFQYLTNLSQTFRRADKFKKEANFEIFDCIEVIKYVMVTYSEQMPHQIQITVKELVRIMIEFLEHNTIDLKNGECKHLIDRLIESEKIFKKYSQFQNSTQKASQEFENSPDFSSRLYQPRVQSNPNVSLTKELSCHSLNTPQQYSRTQKSRFYQEETDTNSQKNTSNKSLTKIQEQEQQDKTSKVNINSSVQSTQTGNSNFFEEPILKVQQNSQFSSGSSPQTIKYTPSKSNKIDSRRFSFESTKLNEGQLKRPSINIQSYQILIKKMYSALRYILTKVGFLLHYQKMQNYFFREEDIMKIKQHQKLRLFQHKRAASFDPSHNDCTPLSNESHQSPSSTYSNIGVMSPFMNSPLSTNSSQTNQKASKEDQFNVSILYQKVNENNDENDIQYFNMIYILRTVRKLENDHILLSKRARRLFYNIKKSILDSNDCFIQKRSFLLHKFLIWKMKRWYTHYKRQKTDNKKIKLFVNQYMEKQHCRICDQKVYLKHFKYHSVLCKEREELKKELKSNMKNINSEMFYFLQKSRSIGVKCQLLQKKIEKIQKLQEQNDQLQLQAFRRKSNQTDDKIIKSQVENNGTKKTKQNQFKEYLVAKKSRNSLSQLEKSKQDQKNNRKSLNLEQQLTCNKIVEDDSSDYSSDDFEETEPQQHSLVQFDKEPEQIERRRKSSGKNIGCNQSLTKKISKNNLDEIQNKENNPNQLTDQHIQDQSSSVSIEKFNSKSDLQIINEQNEYEEDMSRAQISSSDKIINILKQKSNTPQNSLKIGKKNEANSACSILYTSDEDDKAIPHAQQCLSTPNIDISERHDLNKKNQTCQLGLIVEENETSKNPSKEENNLTINELEKENLQIIKGQESLAELACKFEEEKRNQNENDKQKSQNILQSDNQKQISQNEKNQLIEQNNSKLSQNDIKQELSPQNIKEQIQSTEVRIVNEEQQKFQYPSIQINLQTNLTKSEKELQQSNVQQTSQQSINKNSSNSLKSNIEISNSSQQIQNQQNKAIESNNNNEQDKYDHSQKNSSNILEDNNSKTNHTSSQLSSQSISPEIQQKKKNTIKFDLEEKYSILQKSLKHSEILNEVESEISQVNSKNQNTQKDIKNKSNNIRLQLNRLASLEANSLGSPFKSINKISDEKIASQNNSKTSLKEETHSKHGPQQDSFSFFQFNHSSQQQSNSSNIFTPQQQHSSHHQPVQQHVSIILGDKSQKNFESFPELEKNDKISIQIQDSSKQIQDSSKQIQKQSYPPNLRSRIISNPNPSQLAYQRENNSSSPSSTSSIPNENKQLNSMSFTQFKDNAAIGEKKKQSLKANQFHSPVKRNSKLQVTPTNQDSKLVQDVVKLSNDFELKIKQHQLKSSHICLRIFELIQQLSKMFFIQDFQNNWKRKRMILDDNKSKIDFLLQKSMIHKDYANKIQNILQTFTDRVELLEKIQNVEKKLSKQFEDINEEIERTEDNLSIDSSQANLQNPTTSKQLNPRSSVLQVQNKSGTLISSKTQISKDSYMIESPNTQSDQQSLPSNNNINAHQQNNQQQIRSKQKINLSLNQYVNQDESKVTKSQSHSANNSPAKQTDENPINNIIYEDQFEKDKEKSQKQKTTSSKDTKQKQHVDTLIEISKNFFNDPALNSQDSSQVDSSSSVKPTSSLISQTLLQNNRRRLSVQNNLTLDIKNKIFLKANQQLSNSTIKQSLPKYTFKEDEYQKQMNNYQKFDQIMKDAMIKYETDLVQFEQPPKYHDGYFSDGNVEGCYQCLENMTKKESTNQTNIDDFEFIKLISKGAFGRVWLVKKKTTGHIYAAKIVNLAEKMNKNNLMSLQNERDIFGIVSGDFVVKAVYTFSHESYLCFIMEYMIGGDLGGIMQQYGVLDEFVAKFYIAEIILACSQLHKAGIVHRDLKPDNLLLDSKGHLKLTDFGLSDMGMKNRNMENTKQKKVRQEYNNLKRGMDRISSIKGADKIFTSLTPQTKSDKTRELKQMKTNLDVILNKGTIAKKMKNKQKKFRIIGTPDYIPPEVIKGSSNLNSPTIDWWSVGVILFEMLVGIPPFNDESVEKIFENIVNMRIPWDQINIGYGEDEVSPEAEDLMKKLMDPNPATRLGVNGVESIQQHPFFNNFEWQNVRKMSAPVIPEVKNIFDTSNFDKQIQYSEKEKIDPFFGMSKGQDEVNKAKDMLKSYNFQMKRYDILFEENCQQLEEIQKKMKYMEEEIEKDEKELEKLEVEYGSDSDNSEGAQPFNIPKSIVTFQDLESINNNTTSSLYTYPRLTKEGSEEQLNGSQKNIMDDISSQQKRESHEYEQKISKISINQINELDQEHIDSSNQLDN